MKKITPFLWFDTQAEQAAKFYVSVFARSKITSVTRGGPGPKAPVMTVAFRLDGQDFVGLNGGPHFTFTPAISFVVNCKDQQEIDRLWKRLSSGGGAPGRCGWVKDKFGVSWQIVPTGLGALLKKGGAMKALLSMDKLDIARLEQAGAR